MCDNEGDTSILLHTTPAPRRPLQLMGLPTDLLRIVLDHVRLSNRYSSQHLLTFV